MTEPRQTPTRAEFVTLRDYFDSRLAAIDKATSAAYTSMERRLDGMNEFRAAIKDQTQTFLTRTEFNLVLKQMTEDLRMLRESRAELSGKASQGQANLALVLAMIGLILTIVRFFI